MIDRTILTTVSNAETLEYLRARGVTGAFTYIPDVDTIAVGFLMNGHTHIEVLDQDELSHTFCAPHQVGEAAAANEAWAMTRMRRVLRAEWN